MTRGALTRRCLHRAPADFTVPAAEVIGALALVLADVVEAGPAVQTGAGGAGVWLPCIMQRRINIKSCSINARLQLIQCKVVHYIILRLD